MALTTRLSRVLSAVMTLLVFAASADQGLTAFVTDGGSARFVRSAHVAPAARTVARYPSEQLGGRFQ